MSVASRDFLFTIWFSIYAFHNHAVSSDGIDRFRVFCPLSVAVTTVRGALNLVVDVHNDVNGITGESKCVEGVTKRLVLIDG